MDLEVVGRHALLFDDDAMAAFVNSSKALVEWNSLLIDRYDVRHLLPGPLPPRLKRRPVHQLDPAASSLEADLDQERFLDLPSPSSDEQGEEQGNALEPINSVGYHTVAFSYGNSEESAERKDHDTESAFHPHFPVPESLCQNLPPNEKVHQIIARTAMFVSKNGGQSEIILRVKQGDNPTFGFLMPDHHLHPYFRFLVDHHEVLEPGTDKNRSEDTGQAAGALSLLGFAYGSGEDDDGATENTTDSKQNQSEETPISTSKSQGLGHAESSLDATKKDGGISKSPTLPLKKKVPVIKRNHSISSVKTKSTASTKKGDSLDSLSNVADNLRTSVSSKANIDLPILEPTSEMKRVIEKVVEFILKNGREFEAILAEQDRAHGRFPFLLSSNPYHGYYLQVLQNPQESKLPSKGSILEKHGPVGRTGDKKSVVHKGNDNHSFGSVGSDIPSDIDRKEKFKMFIGKSKDGQEPTSRDTQPQFGVSVDAAAAAAILQAATRGIRNPSLEIFTKTSSGNGEGPGSDVGHLSSLSLHSSQPQSSVYKPKQNTEANVSVPVAKIIAQTAAIAAAGEADSSEASMTKEQKLKAERLKRAKMFAAMMKGGAAPLKSESLRGLSVEPPGSGISGSVADTGNLAGKEREGSSVPFDAGDSDKSHKSKEKVSADNDEQRSKRRYRSRSRRHEEEGEEEEEEEQEKREDKRDHKRPRKKHRSHRSRSKRHEEDGEEEEEEKGEDKRDHKHSRKKHRCHRSSHSSPDRHKHKRRHSSSKDMDSPKRTRYDCSSDDEHQHSRHRHKYDSSSDEKHYSSRHRQREGSLSENESRHSRRRHKHYSSSDDEHQHQRRKHKSRSHAVRETDPGEGEIIKKSDQSKTSQGGCASREASIELSKSNDSARAPSQPSEATEVSDDLRAKIRAMLMATL